MIYFNFIYKIKWNFDIFQFRILSQKIMISNLFCSNSFFEYELKNIGNFVLPLVIFKFAQCNFIKNHDTIIIHLIFVISDLLLKSLYYLREKLLIFGSWRAN